MSKKLVKIVINALEDIKAQDIKVIDVKGLTDIADNLIVATGTSKRQLKSMAENVVEKGKKARFQPLGVEGLDAPEWVLVDFGDVVVHMMLPETRQLYALEKLWSVRPKAVMHSNEHQESQG